MNEHRRIPLIPLLFLRNNCPWHHLRSSLSVLILLPRTPLGLVIKESPAMVIHLRSPTMKTRERDPCTFWPMNNLNISLQYIILSHHRFPRQVRLRHRQCNYRNLSWILWAILSLNFFNVDPHHCCVSFFYSFPTCSDAIDDLLLQMKNSKVQAKTFFRHLFQKKHLSTDPLES